MPDGHGRNYRPGKPGRGVRWPLRTGLEKYCIEEFFKVTPICQYRKYEFPNSICLDLVLTMKEGGATPETFSYTLMGHVQTLTEVEHRAIPLRDYLTEPQVASAMYMAASLSGCADANLADFWLSLPL